MKLSPINSSYNQGFGRLIISDDKQTKDIISKLIRDDETFEFYEKQFQKLNSESGEDEVILSGKKRNEFNRLKSFITLKFNGYQDLGVALDENKDGFLYADRAEIEAYFSTMLQKLADMKIPNKVAELFALYSKRL